MTNVLDDLYTMELARLMTWKVETNPPLAISVSRRQDAQTPTIGKQDIAIHVSSGSTREE